MISLVFFKNSSAKFSAVVKHASTFQDFKIDDNRYELILSAKEAFEKWEIFNNIFWTIIDWKDMHVEFEGCKVYSHNDKTRIFYNIQNAHFKWVSYIEDKIAIMFNRPYKKPDNISLVEGKIDDKTADLLIDLYTIHSSR